MVIVMKTSTFSKCLVGCRGYILSPIVHYVLVKYLHVHTYSLYSWFYNMSVDAHTQRLYPKTCTYMKIIFVLEHSFTMSLVEAFEEKVFKSEHWLGNIVLDVDK